MHEAILWDEKFNTGNIVIDYQHKRLVRLINELNEVRMNEELRPFLFETILDEVQNYTKYHFNTEENIMQNAQYSNLAEHKSMHENFIRSLAKLNGEFDKQNIKVDEEVFEFLKNWLFSHIAKEDTKFISEVVSGHGVV